MSAKVYYLQRTTYGASLPKKSQQHNVSECLLSLHAHCGVNPAVNDWLQGADLLISNTLNQ